MSKIRIPNEWVMGENGTGIKSLCAGLASARLMLVQKRPLGSYMMFAVLLQNMMLIDDPESNKVAKYYGNVMPVPASLHEDLNSGL